MRLAVVDDQQPILWAFSALMKNTEHETDAFLSGKDAFEAIAKSPGRYGLLLVDIYLKDEDGVSFAKKVREIQPGIPIIFMTGNVTEEKKKEALLLGRVTFLEKPFPLVEVIRETIAELVQNPNQR